ncbi:DUF6942 family protein [Neptuniibacter sp. PT34_22]|uniref:DUF6942 family protein n=1 Tax=Neptuniibacter sp. PT34_22 TaxID=3398205 RepID=UPI0039F56B38
MTVGLGAQGFKIAIYIANRPPIEPYPTLDHLRPLSSGEIKHIADQTGNHWRKIFNVSAKFLFELQSDVEFKTWQVLRDQSLFQAESPIALLFSKPDLTEPNRIHIIAGKTYAQALGLENLLWLDPYFAIDKDNKVIVCPYLDYRQLSNARISQLVGLVKNLSP